MKTRLLLLFLVSFAINNLHAVRPTLQPTVFTASNISCNTIQLSWVNGNGNARIIVAREGGATTFTPADSTVYTPSAAFGQSTAYNSDNYIVFNSSVLNFITITNLEHGKTYYFTIYEHDNTGSSTLYNTTAPPSQNGTTYNVTLNFSITVTDSCQRNNLFTFTNTSTSNVTGITYSWDFGDGNTSSAAAPSHSYTISGAVLPAVKSSSSLSGCSVYKQKTIRVYRNKNVFIDKSKFNDSIQCFRGNHFTGLPTSLANTLSMSYRYNWFLGDGTYSDFAKLNKSYSKSGIYDVVLIINTYSFKGDSLGCNDTMKMKLQVLPELLNNISIPVKSHVLKNNSFTFDNNNLYLKHPHWHFGDGDTALRHRTTHTYKDTGHYTVTHTVLDSSTGCADTGTYIIIVKPDPVSGIQHLTGSSGLKIYPNPASSELNIECSNGLLIVQINITDICGKTIQTIRLQSPSSLANITTYNLVTGIYGIEVITDKGTRRQVLQKI